jgi:mycoredoxin
VAIITDASSERAQNNDMTVQVYTTAWCRDCRSAKEFLTSHGVAFTEVDVDADPAASAEVLKRVGKRAIPQLVIDGEWFQPYTPNRGLLIDELCQRLGIPRG